MRCSRSRRDEYLRHTLRVHGADILRFNPDFVHDPADDQDAFLVEKGDETVGVVLLRRRATPPTCSSTTSRLATATSPRASSSGARAACLPPGASDAWSRLPAWSAPTTTASASSGQGDSWLLEVAVITVFVRRVLPVVGMGAVLMVVATRMVIPGTAADTYFHLRFGHEFLGGWAIRSPGHLGPFDTATWIPTQWLAQVGMAGIEDALGLAGILWVSGTLTMVLLVLVYFASPAPRRAAPGSARHRGLLRRCSPRPVRAPAAAQLRVHRRRRARLARHSRRPPPPLLARPARVGVAHPSRDVALRHHGGRRRHRRVGTRPTSPRGTLLRLAAIPVASLALSAATPIGLDAFRSLVSVGSRSDYFVEWGAPDFTSLSSFVLLR